MAKLMIIVGYIQIDNGLRDSRHGGFHRSWQRTKKELHSIVNKMSNYDATEFADRIAKNVQRKLREIERQNKYLNK